MNSCENQIETLLEEVDQHIWTFRWLWILNLAGIVWGIAVGHYDLAILAAVSALIALIGVGRTRRGRRLIARVAEACLRVRAGEEREPEPQ